MTGKVDVERVRSLLGELNEARRKMKLIAAEDEEAFLGDFRNRDAAKYQLIVAIEASIDVCSHLVASLGGRAPSDYADCFSVLADLGVVTETLVDRLRTMARFRNLVVHLYWVVDDRRVFEILRNDATDLDDFRDAVLGWLKREGLLEGS